MEVEAERVKEVSFKETLNQESKVSLQQPSLRH